MYSFSYGNKFLIVVLFSLIAISCCQPLHASQSLSAKDVLLDGSGWRMGSFAIGTGEKAGAYAVNFDDSLFHSVVVPGDTQLQAAFNGVKGLLETKELIAVNEKEWWYRKQFRVPSVALGSSTGSSSMAQITSRPFG